MKLFGPELVCWEFDVYNEHFNKENIKKTHLEIKNSITEIKNVLKEMNNSRLRDKEEYIHDLEDRILYTSGYFTDLVNIFITNALNSLSYKLFISVPFKCVFFPSPHTRTFAPDRGSAEANVSLSSPPNSQVDLSPCYRTPGLALTVAYSPGWVCIYL